MLALHLLQSALVHVNTLLLQQVLAEPAWAEKLSEEDRRGLTALFWSNINPLRHLPTRHGQAARPHRARDRASVLGTNARESGVDPVPLDWDAVRLCGRL